MYFHITYNVKTHVVELNCIIPNNLAPYNLASLQLTFVI